MSEAKFTKGEWEVEEGKVVVCNGFKVSYAYSGSNIPLTSEINANAHIIAAAPEMYKLLIRIQQEGGLSVARHRSISKLLAKARGEK